MADCLKFFCQHRMYLSENVKFSESDPHIFWNIISKLILEKYDVTIW